MIGLVAGDRDYGVGFGLWVRVSLGLGWDAGVVLVLG